MIMDSELDRGSKLLTDMNAKLSRASMLSAVARQSLPRSSLSTRIPILENNIK
jgi:hypothetical protein